ncbi:MAG TPA: DNA mismatch repair protein MutS [Chlamydiales bacterium]|nr:DNA mismatch repair protein MutS [Chlamydiales bacterium]
MTTKEKTTPMMQQWHYCKKKAKNALLFFRLGDFYEAFYEDAKIISNELSLTLTKRQDIPMCGVPFHASGNYIDKLLVKGFKIAIAEQMEDPKQTKGIVKRDIKQIISPGTVIESNLIEEKANNYFLSIAQVSETFGIAAIDISTGEFKIFEIDNKKDLITQLYRLKAKEFLISEKFLKDHLDIFENLKIHYSFTYSSIEKWRFNYEHAYESLIEHFQLHSLDSFGLKGLTAAINAAGALISYVKEDLNQSLQHITAISKESLSGYMGLDFSCMRNLELIEPLYAHNKNATLLSHLDQTSTPMGSRLLRNWVKQPLMDLNKIHERLEATENFIQADTQTLHENLSLIRDIERLIMKIISGFAIPKDLIALKVSLKTIPQIKRELEKIPGTLIQKHQKELINLEQLTDYLETSIDDSPPIRVSDGNVIKRGYNTELDELRDIGKNSVHFINEYQNQLREETQIKNLRIKYNKIFGYYIEVSNGQTNKVPSSFSRKQTLVNAERFITEDLKEFEQKALLADEKIKILEQSLYQTVIEEILKYSHQIIETAKGIASIDALTSLAKVAKKHQYIKPCVDSSHKIEITEGYHPIIASQMNLGTFIPNDTTLSDTNQLYLITGPNMAGKSTYLRQVALIVILAQIGSFVPAKKAHIGMVDKVFTRIGASDDLTRGQSTFMVEMSETANILNNASDRSLIILDEIGRGTSTYDGIAIAYSVIKYLLEQKGKKAKTLFATHYFELTDLEKTYPQVSNYNIAVKEIEGEITFLHRIEKGIADKSYGIHVAKLAGVPRYALQIAAQKLKELEKEEQPKKKKQNQQLSLFAPPTPQPIEDLLKKKISSYNLNATTPIEAIQLLQSLQEMVKSYD